MNEMLTKMLQFFGLSSLFGWIILVSGIRSRREQRRRELFEYNRAMGHIAEYAAKEKTGKYGKYIVYCPIVEFTANGRLVRREYENNLNRDDHPVGTEVAVLYDMCQPEHFHLESDLAFARGAGNLIKIGLIWIVLAAALTLALAVFVGGLHLDLRNMVRIVKRIISN